MKNNGSLGYLTREGMRNLYVNRLMSIASVSVLFSCMVMIGVAFMIMVNINMFIGNVVASERFDAFIYIVSTLCIAMETNHTEIGFHQSRLHVGDTHGRQSLSLGCQTSHQPFHEAD